MCLQGEMWVNIHDTKGFMNGFCVTINAIMFMNNNSFKLSIKACFSTVLWFLKNHFSSKMRLYLNLKQNLVQIPAWNLWEARKRKHIIQKEVHKLQRKCPLRSWFVIDRCLKWLEENNFNVKETKITIPKMFSGSVEVHLQFFDCFYLFKFLNFLFSFVIFLFLFFILLISFYKKRNNF